MGLLSGRAAPMTGAPRAIGAATAAALERAEAAVREQSGPTLRPRLDLGALSSRVAEGKR